jgi:hypothetical protein
VGRGQSLAHVARRQARTAHLACEAQLLAFVIKPFVCTAFCMAMAAMTYLSRKEGDGPSTGSIEAGIREVMRSSPSASLGSSRVVFGRR